MRQPRGVSISLAKSSSQAKPKRNVRSKAATAKAAAANKRDEPVLKPHLKRGLLEGLFILCLAVGAYLLAAIASYSPQDPGWSYGGLPGAKIQNLGGVFGAWIADVSRFCLGYMAWLLPLVTLYIGWLALQRARQKVTESDPAPWWFRLIGLVLTITAGCALVGMHFLPDANALPVDNAGGMLGAAVSGLLIAVIDLLGATLLLLTAFLVGITLLTDLSWLALMDKIGRWAWTGVEKLKVKQAELSKEFKERSKQRQEKSVEKQIRKVRQERTETVREKIAQRKPPKIEPKVAAVPLSKRAEAEKQQTLFNAPEGELPPLSLLDEPPPHGQGYSKQALEAIAQRVETKLRDFGVEVEVVSVNSGPVVTRFELQPAPGVKGSQISNLARDLARALSTIAVRVVEVIPGKPYIGLEVPNEEREVVTLSEILKSQAYDQAGSRLTMALGKDIGGHPVCADLGKMPHVLVAGTTGAGKSVAINVMLLSLLYKATPQEVRLILVDPKMLELSVYDGIPHLLTPVVTDMQDAANALRWSVAEMDRRYKLMSALGVRNIAGYNKKITDAASKGETIPDPLWTPTQPIVPDLPPEDMPEPEEHPALETLPFIVIMIDELSDLMLVVGKKVEELILRLAQKARASGIHLVLATQRPSVDVITGLIRANIPSRIAFQVATKVDSRTILDQMGAETLLGRGDMLYLPPTSPLPERVHGAFVDDHEVHKVVKFLKDQGEPQYNEDIVNASEEAAAGGAGGGGGGDVNDAEADALYDQAVQIVTQTRKASISGVQRRLRIGYNRAARLVEQMELAGVVSEMLPNGQREVIAPPPPKD